MWFWRDGSVVKNTDWSSRQLGSVPSTHMVLITPQLLITPILEDLMALLCLHMVHKRADKTPICKIQ